MQVNILGTNKCEIVTKNGIYFQSYKSIVAKKYLGKVTLYPKWDYSCTTSKHVGQWLKMPCKEIRQKIKQGEIIVERYEPKI